MFLDEGQLETSIVCEFSNGLEISTITSPMKAQLDCLPSLNSYRIVPLFARNTVPNL